MAVITVATIFCRDVADGVVGGGVGHAATAINYIVSGSFILRCICSHTGS